MCEKNEKILRVSDLNEKVQWKLSGTLEDGRHYIQCSLFTINREERKFLKEEFSAQEVKVNKNTVRFIFPAHVKIEFDLK